MPKVLLSLDQNLLRRIDAEARRRGVTRSGFVSRLLDDALGGGARPPPGGRPRGALAPLDALFAARRGGGREDATVAVRAGRDQR